MRDSWRDSKVKRDADYGDHFIDDLIGGEVWAPYNYGVRGQIVS
jgi:hypothetical protein